ncbi:MAG: hypothetical protein P1V20_14170 [Verrucomicrobiales bacterium]|nr:hypothetical protein [Verrucomicrobiales bacterium]
MRLSSFSGILLVVLSLSWTGVQAEEKAGTTLFKALGSLMRPGKDEKCKVVAEVPPMPTNNLSSPSDGLTPTGNRLQPFGQPAYWDRKSTAAAAQPDDELALLPPLPDLRTPDQITNAERRRNAKNAKFAARQAKNQAAEEARRMAELVELERNTMPDPSTALIQVESSRKNAQGFGKPERPSTANGGLLKPFNAGSSYTEDCEVKFQWSDHQFVENQPDPAEDELGFLPPLPDLRTPDQVTRSERMRNLRNLKFRSRQARESALRREADENVYTPVYPYR